MKKFAAVIFDIGGVVVSSPLAGIAQYEKQEGLPADYINVAIVSQGSKGAWQRLERGELRLSQFYDQFSRDLSDPLNRGRYLRHLLAKTEKTGGTAAAHTAVAAAKAVLEAKGPLSVDGQALFTLMMTNTAANPDMLNAIQRLRAAGFKVAALTNNYKIDSDSSNRQTHTKPSNSSSSRQTHTKPSSSSSSRQTHTNPSSSSSSSSPMSHLWALFDDVVESAECGYRKPDPRIYKLSCQRLGVHPSEVIFLDDLGMNLKPARQLGMETIRVKLYKEHEALRKLERLVGIPLLANSSSSPQQQKVNTERRTRSKL